ncbi:hypothetical protein [Planotetraspora sp. GP83]|uniref:hypothetical protein n=1 Tax=Planotetraspora sp. GP83 TaxID=3156264 RepID=UPI003510EC14
MGKDGGLGDAEPYELGAVDVNLDRQAVFDIGVADLAPPSEKSSRTLEVNRSMSSLAAPNTP